MNLAACAAVLTISFAVAFSTTRVLVRVLRGHGVLDVPNERSSHRVPTPRGGGLGVLAGFAAVCVACRWLGLPLLEPALIAGAVLVALVSAADDYFGRVSLAVRATVQLVAASLVVLHFGGLARLPLPPPADIPLGVFGTPLAILWIVAVTNLYNFLDGIDGLAACQGLIAGSAAALLYTQTASAPAGLALAGACAGFLILNWHPARIFLGDVGSATLGFLFAVLPFEVAPPTRSRAVYLMAICLWVFLSDGAFTLLRRLLRGEEIWKSHRTHLYQRLVKTGLRHDTVVLTILTFSVPLAALAVAAGRLGAATVDWGLLAISLVLFLVYLRWTVRSESRAPGFYDERSGHPSSVGSGS